jgi:transcription antitermination protein NusB
LSRRHRARKIVLDVLYHLEIERVKPADVLDDYREEMAAKQIGEFVERMVAGIVRKMPELDAIIDDYADKWALNRMPILDRNILRIGVYELRYEDDIPASVSINEMVELANMYSTDDSGRFVNGILGRLVKDRERERNEKREEATELQRPRGRD